MSSHLTAGRGMGKIAAGGGWRPTSGCFRCATFSEAMMKAILSMALMFVVYGLAGAADDKAGIRSGHGSASMRSAGSSGHPP